MVNLPVDFLLKNKSRFKFKNIISSNDPIIFNHFKNSQNFLWLHNKLPIEKALRKKKFFPIITNKVSAIFVSDYLSKKTTSIYNFKKKIVIPNFLDPIFSKTKPRINRKPYFIWSVQRKKGLKEIINIWIEKVYKINPNTKLFIFGTEVMKIPFVSVLLLISFKSRNLDEVISGIFDSRLSSCCTINFILSMELPIIA